MSNNDNTIELQQVTLATILKDSYILAQIKNDIKIDFFDKYSYKVIYKALLYFYSRYGKLPEKTDLIIVLKDLSIDEYGSIEEVKKDLQELYDLPMSSLEFTADQVSRFIKKRRIEDTLTEFLPRIRKGDNLVIDDLGEALAKNVAVSLHNSKAFMLSNESLLPDVRRESVGSDDNPTVIRSLIEGVNNSLLYKGYKSGDVIIVVAKPGCGKTMFMVNELANASKQGYNALHLFIGDITDYDGFVRYLSNVSDVPQDSIVSMREDEQIQLIRQTNLNGELDRITVKSYAAGEITVEQMIEDVFKIQNDLKCHYDIIAVDYPDNLVKESENMYDSGGDIYNRLSYLARRNKCVVLAGSQPKISYWNDEIIPLSGCAESSKKQHIADAIIALGKPSSNAELLTGFLAKVRRGTMGTIFRLKTNFSKAKIIPISEFEYISMKTDNANSAD